MIKECKTTEQDLPKHYLQALNGILKLTAGEIGLTSRIISRYRLLGADGLREPYLSKFIFSTDERKLLRDGEESTQSFSNKLTQLVTKRVLLQDKEGMYSLDESLLPQPEVTFKFILTDDKPSKDI